MLIQTFNFVKIVQRMPVKIILDSPPEVLRSITRDVCRGIRDIETTASLLEAPVPVEYRERRFGIACILRWLFGYRFRVGCVI